MNCIKILKTIFEFITWSGIILTIASFIIFIFAFLYDPEYPNHEYHVNIYLWICIILMITTALFVCFYNCLPEDIERYEENNESNSHRNYILQSPLPIVNNIQDVVITIPERVISPDVRNLLENISSPSNNYQNTTVEMGLI